MSLLAKIIFFYKYISYNSSFGFPVKIICTLSWCSFTSICIYKNVVNSSNLISSKDQLYESTPTEITNCAGNYTTKDI